MERPTLLAAAFCMALGAGVLAQEAGSVGSRVAERSPLLVDRLDALFESAPASALSEINDDHLYVVDYGVMRRNEPNERVVLVSYPIPRR